MTGADQQTAALLDRTRVRLVGVRPASEVVRFRSSLHLLHAGPPLRVEEAPGPMRGAIVGALVFEGVAGGLEESTHMVERGEVELTPCHACGGVGAMAGIVTPSMPVVVVETDAGGRAFSPLNEGLGRALRFGSNDPDVLGRLAWIRDVAAPLLDAAIAASDPIDLTALQAEGLRRGDECHNRNLASSAGLVLRLAPAICRAASEGAIAAQVIEYASRNPHFFLPFSMAAAKAIGDAAAGVAGSGIVTGICANGWRVGVRVSGTGDRWFEAEAPLGVPCLFEGYTLEDAQPMMGDSFATEVVGLGAFALTAAPAITRFIGGDAASSARLVEEMRAITVTESTRFRIPFENFRGTPLGIDVRRVAATGIAPVVNNGIAHREPGRGQVGAGVTRMPLAPFVEAAAAIDRRRSAGA
ncbi:MAG TPA: DUF1116 domain-containing protein [Candidatus Dormibacteraeota bacterium]|nr:DUF1116 domain-containing protein [Candidatus Dormibacteraeota bacterium]